MASVERSEQKRKSKGSSDKKTTNRDRLQTRESLQTSKVTDSKSSGKLGKWAQTPKGQTYEAHTVLGSEAESGLSPLEQSFKSHLPPPLRSLLPLDGLASTVADSGNRTQGRRHGKEQARSRPARWGDVSPERKEDFCWDLSGTKKRKFHCNDVSVNPLHHVRLQRPKITFILTISKLEISKNT